MFEVLCREEGIQENITQSLSIDRAATVRALRHLEREGFVERRYSQTDKRKIHFHTTGKTSGLRGRIMDILQQHWKLLFSGFDAEEQSLILEMPDRMIRNMREE